jgi:hypothetical protein
MATINKTIASSGGDYTSRSLAEASIPGSGADDYIFTVNEAFTDTTPVVVSFGGTNTMEVTVAEAYRCKGAVTGTHAELKYTTNDLNDLVSTTVGLNVTWRHDRLIRQGAADASVDVFNAGHSAGTVTLDRCTLVGDACYGRTLRVVASGNVTVMGCFFVDRNSFGNAADIVFFQGAGTFKFYRNTVFISEEARAGGVRAHLTGTSVDARQNLVIKAAGATLTNGCFYVTSSGAFAAGCDANGATDTTCPGTNANNSLTPGDVLTTLTVGSENLHYPSRTAMQALTAGSSLSATVGTVDLDGETINVWYPGADYVFGVPTLSSASPDNGPVAGGTAVTLTGTNFTDVTGVTFGGTAATGVSVVNDTSITCTTPAHSSGAVSVLVTNADGSNTANSLFTYNAPAVTGVGSAVRLRFGFGRR